MLKEFLYGLEGLEGIQRYDLELRNCTKKGQTNERGEREVWKGGIYTQRRKPLPLFTIGHVQLVQWFKGTLEVSPQLVERDHADQKRHLGHRPTLPDTSQVVSRGF